MTVLTEKDKVDYLIAMGWTPHPKNPDRFWKSPNHKNEYVTYGTEKAFDSQKAFEDGTTLQSVKAARSVSKGAFWAVMIGTDGRVTYAKEDGSCDLHRGRATKFPDLKEAVTAANKVLEVNPKFGFWGFEAVQING